MREWVGRAIAASMMLAVFCGLAAALSFNQDPVLGNRRVELHWTPGEDDPLFTGNLRLYFLGNARVAQGGVSFIGFTRSGQELWLWDDSERCFAGYEARGDSLALISKMSPLEQDEQPLSFALHPEGILLMAGLADGRVAAWRPRLSTEMTVYDGHVSGCRGLVFKPLAGDVDSSYVSVGEDGYWRHWARPGVLQHEVPADQPGPLTAVTISRLGDAVAVGSQEGLIGIYLISANSPRAAPDGHQGRTITGLSFSADGSRLASADADGGVRVWGAEFGNLLGSSDPAVPTAIQIAYTPRESRYVSFATEAGVIGLIDGYTGRPYDTVEDLGRELTGFVLSPDGSAGYFGDADGMLEWWYLGVCVPSERTPECFGGYIVWRGLHPEPDSLQLLRVYNFADTTWGWSSFDTTRSFVDPDSIIPRGGDPEIAVAGPHNGVPYYYSLTRYSWRFLDGGVFRVLRDSKMDGFYRDDPSGQQIAENAPMPLIPRVDAVSVPPLLRDLYVVPNPYVESDDTSSFGPLTPPMVQFYNLPAEATIRIYTASGDLVQTLEHVPTPGDRSGGACAWNLKNEDDRDVASGIYLFAVEAPGGERSRGFFTIIR
jgi:hypothetical protein